MTAAASLSGAGGLALVLALSFGTILLLAWMMLGAGARIRRERDLVRRMTMSSGSDPEEEEEAEARSAVWMPEFFVKAGGRFASAGGFGAGIEAKLERAGVPVKAGEFVAGTGVAIFLGALVGLVVLQNMLFVVVLAVAAGLIPTVLLRISTNKRSTKLHDQMADILMILASSLRAGHSFFQALDMVSKEIGEPGASEFGRVVSEVRLGRPVDEAMNSLAERIGSDDLRWAVLAVNVQREVGGNLAEILDTVAETVRERDAVRRQIRVLSAEGRLSISILTALPFLVGLYIAKVNPGYLNLLFSTRVGLVMVGTAACLMTLGIMWMRKVVRIDV